MKSERIDLKVLPEDKKMLQLAAKYSGQTLTEFLLRHAKMIATEVISEHERILASKEDEALFFEALRNPPKPNEKLRNAAAKYLGATNS